MKTNFLIFAGLSLLTGCQATGPIMKNSISFRVDNQYWPNHSMVYKNSWPLCAEKDLMGKKYITSLNTCKVAPEGYVPQQIIIEYAPWLTYEEQQKIPELKARQVLIIGDEVRNGVLYKEVVKGKDANALNYNLTVLAKNEEAAIDKLPASAWKRVVLTPPTEVAKYKFQTPEGSGNPSRGKEIHYIISLNPDGTYSIKTELYWKQPYQKNWN